MKRQHILILVALTGALFQVSCGGHRHTRHIVVSEVTHFEIQGDGKSLNFPIFAQTIDVEQIVRSVNLAEYYYEKLSSLYDFKTFRFIATSPTECLLEKEGDLHRPQMIYTFEDSLSKVDISLIAFANEEARYAFRISDVPARQIRDHYVDVPSGQSASIGTLYDHAANKGHLIIISMISQEITDALTPEEFADFLKRKNASIGLEETGGFEPSDQRWMDEIFGPGTYELPVEMRQVEDIIGKEEWQPFDVPPEIVGGMQSLVEKIKYPKSAKADKIEGRVILKLRVNESGGVTWVKVVKGVRADLDSAAVDVLRQTKFKPAMWKGKPISMSIAVPIEFKLQK
jgi:TonB family protein